MSNISRREAVKVITSYPPVEAKFDFAQNPTGGLFGSNVFSLDVMKYTLPKAVYKSLKQTIENGAPLDINVADAVAAAMKEWAMSRGATHYAHVFYPLTGRTAEKHDSFYEPDGSSKISEFSGALLVQQEPDGSSFPNGGIRSTHQARGYTAWDVTSPAYLTENVNGITLCIPTVFVSWTGEALDKKTPLLRSMQALNKQAQRVLKLFGHESIAQVSATAGAEQEYFLIDSNFVMSRPDLMAGNRTLFGSPPPKGQEFDDHYFGIIPDRVQAFMLEFERELFKLGIPVKTRHNEVAPGQYEVAPVFETANVSADHQQLIMANLQKVATRYGLTAILHEKPFAGVNGSGKHVNWSLGNSTQGNLLDPGETPHDNAQFLLFCTAVIRAVSQYAPLLRAVIASASNDHRLGANEAPPAIISIFLGDQLADVFEQIKEKGSANSSLPAGTIELGVGTLPQLPKHAGDRNRTSPFAFTGNKFEFRAVGSFQSIADPLTALNTIVSESLDYIATQLEAADGDLYDAINALIKEVLEEHGNVIFNGDGYSEEWHKEAEEERGLPNLRTTVDALPQLVTEKVVSLFEKYDVLSEAESHSRYEVYLEQYIMSLQVEAKLMLEIGKTMIFPAAIRYQGELAATCANLKAVGYDFDTDTLDKVTALVKGLQDSMATLEEALAHEADDALAEATAARDHLIPAMNSVRKYADQLEDMVADDLWPLPTYQEMLFIR